MDRLTDDIWFKLASASSDRSSLLFDMWDEEGVFDRRASFAPTGATHYVLHPANIVPFHHLHHHLSITFTLVKPNSKLTSWSLQYQLRLADRRRPF